MYSEIMTEKQATGRTV